MSQDPSQPQESQKNEPFMEVLARCSAELAKAIQTMKPGDPRLLTIVDNFARLQQIMAVERLQNAVEQATTDRERLKFMRLLNQTLSLQQRTAARMQREALAKEKEARRAQLQKPAPITKPVAHPVKPIPGIPKAVRVHGLPIPFLGPPLDRRRPDVALRMERPSRRGNRLRPSLVAHYNRTIF